jgi:hypothetical protein
MIYRINRLPERLSHGDLDCRPARYEVIINHARIASSGKSVFVLFADVRSRSRYAC